MVPGEGPDFKNSVFTKKSNLTRTRHTRAPSRRQVKRGGYRLASGCSVLRDFSDHVGDKKKLAIG